MRSAYWREGDLYSWDDTPNSRFVMDPDSINYLRRHPESRAHSYIKVAFEYDHT